ncbi:MAG: pyridoxamine 5'-phosphate oxidase family protein [Steroidobacteraceae bacterium]
MDVETQSTVGMQKLADLIGQAQIGMLTTSEPSGQLRSCPLVTLQLDAEGRLWFFISRASAKTEEIAQHRQVNLSYSDPDRQDYVSVSGAAEVVRSREKMRELWTPWVEPYFPRGLEDPDLALLCVQVGQAEYWDAPESNVERLYGFSKAIATGDTKALGEHARVKGPAH